MNFRLNKKKVITIAIVLIIMAVLAVGAALGLSLYVMKTTGDRIISPRAAAEMTDVDCIIVLGCRVNDVTPSPMLTDRLNRAVEIFELGAAPKLLMSGDHGRKDYDEVNAMKQYAIDKGIASEDIFMDHAGFSTYETMYRAAEIFQAKKVIIVTQEYHLYRSIYIANALGMDAYGVSSDFQPYVKQAYYDIRECLARDKDVIKCIFKPEPTYLGEVIPISGNGDVTNDKEFI